MSPHDIRRRIWDQLRQKDLRAFAALLPAEVVLQAARRPSSRPAPASSTSST